eukprot:1159940-Rhodomonas_salina.1
MSGDLAGEEDAEGVCDEDGGRRSRVCRSVHGMRLCCTLQFMECDALSWWNATLKSKTRVRGHVAVLYDCGCVGFPDDTSNFADCSFDITDVAFGLHGRHKIRSTGVLRMTHAANTKKRSTDVAYGDIRAQIDGTMLYAADFLVTGTL